MWHELALDEVLPNATDRKDIMLDEPTNDDLAALRRVLRVRTEETPRGARIVVSFNARAYHTDAVRRFQSK